MTRTIVAITLFSLVTCFANVHAEIIGGVEFPDGAVSFADVVVSYDPVIDQYNDPDPWYRDGTKALGIPQGTVTFKPEPVDYVSLGDGGSITLQFTDNFLTVSGDSDDDLWIFEVGGDVEDTFVEISKDNSTWYGVGKVFGATSGIDIDSFGFGPSDFFAYVRLTDDSGEGGQSGDTVGADIDAVGAISSISVVDIDIKPGSYPNSINLGSNGKVPVAILSSETFDATTVDPYSVTLAGATVAVKGKAETPMASVEDVNGDGLDDLVVHVDTEALGLTEGDVIAILEGETYDGMLIIGEDTIRVVP